MYDMASRADQSEIKDVDTMDVEYVDRTNDYDVSQRVINENANKEQLKFGDNKSVKPQIKNPVPEEKPKQELKVTEKPSEKKEIKNNKTGSVPALDFGEKQ